MMQTCYYQFRFPEDKKLLPRNCSYTVTPSGLGVIETDNASHVNQLNGLCSSGVGSVRLSTKQDTDILFKETKTIEQIGRIHSFTRQTKWISGFFDISDDQTTSFFNCGLEWWDGSLHLFTRRCQYTPATLLRRRSEDNDLAIFRLNPNLSVQSCVIPYPPNRHTREQWEDPRAFIFNGECYVSMATLIRGIGFKIRQCVVKMSEDLSKFSVFSEPHFGGNHSEPPKAISHEKNWTWFTHDEKLHCVYSLNPLSIFTLIDGVADAVPTISPKQLPWSLGTLRGGTNPEFHDGCYWVFFHSSLPWRDALSECNVGTKRRYYLGALTFSGTYPFQLLSITPNFLLQGSEEDPRTRDGPPVVFPCGAKLINGEWLITMGINDEKCGWISIPHKELKELLVPTLKC